VVRVIAPFLVARMSSSKDFSDDLIFFTGTKQLFFDLGLICFEFAFEYFKESEF